jgi:hypothetical protein
MNQSAVIDAFPRRPIALIKSPDDAKARMKWLAILLLLLLPGLYWGWSLHETSEFKQYLRTSGAEAEVLSADGNCFSRRQISGDNPRGCNFEIEYVLRPEHGGQTLRADVWHDGARPIFTPPALYDPADPSRVMLRPEAERDYRWTEWIGVPIALLIPLAGLLLWFLSRNDPLEAALADPRPVAVPVERFARLKNALQVWFRREPGGKELLQVFPVGATPFLLSPPGGNPDERPWALALLAANGRPLLLDSELRRLDLTGEERSRILGGV